MLTRVNSKQDYEAFDMTKDIWKFNNKASNMWPEAWWKTFDYKQGTDPYTKEIYPETFTASFINAESQNFPDWPLYVKTFGVDKCYHNRDIAHYNAKALKHWKTIKSAWAGSCTGFAVSSFMSFSDKNKLIQTYPQMPKNYQSLFSIGLNDDVREVINSCWVRQLGKDMWQVTYDKGDLTVKPNDTLNELRKMLLSEIRDDKILIINHNNGSGGHATAPYAIKKTNNPNKLSIKIYDNSYPNSGEEIIIDTAQNTWTSTRYINWGGNKFIALDHPLSKYYNIEIAKKNPNIASKSNIEISNSHNFYNSSETDITITNGSGKSIGYSNNLFFSDISNASPIIIPTGGLSKPIGYKVPIDNYSISLDYSKEIDSYFIHYTDSLIYDCTRLNVQSGERDEFRISSGFGIKNDSDLSKTYNFDATVIGDNMDKVFDFSNLGMVENDSLHFDVFESDKMKLVNSGAEKSYDLNMRLTTPSLQTKFFHDKITLGANSTQKISAVWEELDSTPIKIVIDEDNDGIFDDSLLVKTNLPVLMII